MACIPNQHPSVFQRLGSNGLKGQLAVEADGQTIHLPLWLSIHQEVTETRMENQGSDGLFLGTKACILPLNEKSKCREHHGFMGDFLVLSISQ